MFKVKFMSESCFINRSVPPLCTRGLKTLVSTIVAGELFKPTIFLSYKLSITVQSFQRSWARFQNQIHLENDDFCPVFMKLDYTNHVYIKLGRVGVVGGS